MTQSPTRTVIEGCRRARRRLGVVIGVAGITALVGAPHSFAGTSANMLVFTLNGPSASIAATVDGATVPLNLRGGFVVLKTNTPACVPSPQQPCSYVIQNLGMSFNNVVVQGVTVTGPSLSMAGPINAVDTGAGLAIPAGLSVLAAGTIQGTQNFNLLPNPESATISLDLVKQHAELMGSFATTVTAGPDTFNVAVTYLISADSPFTTMPGCPSPSDVTSGLLGFESLDWTVSGSSAQLALASTPVTQGCHALSVHGQGYISLNGPPFSTAQLGPTTPTLALDAWVPPGQPNPNYFGAVQIYLTCPSANSFNQYIGQDELTGLPTGQYSTLRFAIPAPILSMLTTSHPDCFFSVNLNINSTPTPLFIDDLRFVQ